MVTTLARQPQCSQALGLVAGGLDVALRLFEGGACRILEILAFPTGLADLVFRIRHPTPPEMRILVVKVVGKIYWIFLICNTERSIAQGWDR